MLNLKLILFSFVTVFFFQNNNELNTSKEYSNELQVELSIHPNPKFDKNIYLIIVKDNIIETTDQNGKKKKKKLKSKELTKMIELSEACYPSSYTIMPSHLEIKTCILVVNNKIRYQGILNSEEMLQKSKELLDLLIELSPIKIEI